MYQSDAEMLFPVRVIPQLQDLRGQSWQELVERVSQLPESAPDSLAFALMMIRIDGCLNCNSDSFRAMRGCTLCARQAIARFKGSDSELLELFQAARRDVNNYLMLRRGPND